MQSAIIRLALGQITAVVYSVLVVGVLLKVRFGSPAPPIFATLLRDHGFLLLVVPAGWLVWAAFAAHYPRAEMGDAGPILLAGVVILGLLIAIAFVGTVSVATYRSVRITVPAKSVWTAARQSGGRDTGRARSPCMDRRHG